MRTHLPGTDDPANARTKPPPMLYCGGRFKAYWNSGGVRRRSAGTCPQNIPDEPAMRVAHETIYRDLYDWRGGSLDRGSCRMLRTKRDRRKPSRLMPRRRSRFSGNVLMISDRPFAPTDRSKAGAWEDDLVMGRHNRSAIGTLVERASRYTIVVPVDAAKRSESLRDSLITAFSDIPAQLRTSITWDQGWEMSLHEQITAATGADLFL